MNDEYKTFKPTIWNRLGFCRSSAYLDDAEESTLHEIHIHFDWADRLRILISGNGMVSLRVNVSDVTDTATRFSVTPPGMIE